LQKSGVSWNLQEEKKGQNEEGNGPIGLKGGMLASRSEGGEAKRGGGKTV